MTTNNNREFTGSLLSADLYSSHLLDSREAREEKEHREIRKKLEKLFKNKG